MKKWWKISLVTALVLLLAAAPALALGESLDEATVKLQTFLDELAAQGTPVDTRNLDAATREQSEDGVASIYCQLADYLFLSAQSDDSGITYALDILHADRPDEVDADALYAQFLRACAGGEPAQAADTIAWLRKNMVRTSYYGMDGIRAFGEYSVLLSASRTDSEETLYVLGFTDE